ncbi:MULTISPECIES: FDLD family class I lanthipeptide [unclassified Streptomyces]|uniref:FDLD family class I lanthipeptide n=1 Tax=unclassified Streptomyces TaxID=2593676 RepID=UPI002E807380|nr:FDLD family class I lanthipeptide [Streptomyces sp. NBC_00503]WUD85684.1 FDLD family class I lanthipeptide [Streptomyces sp. NBC_00503]
MSNAFNLDARVSSTGGQDPQVQQATPTVAISIASRVGCKKAINWTIKRTIAMTTACASQRTKGKC